jgi:hypothetical protein
MQNRLNEMQDRRRRLIRYVLKKEGRIEEFETTYPDTVQRKENVIGKF